MPPLPVSEFKHRLDQQLKLMQTLVEMESPTTDKPALDALGGFMAERMRNAAAEVQRFAQEKAGDHWLGQWGSGPG
ncbi:MAG: hypothetical protein PVJ07_02220, partial [Anaerolineales bacterium]